MDKLVLRTTKETITSVELLEKINELRKEEGERNKLKHNTLLRIIRDELCEQNILPTSGYREIAMPKGGYRKEKFYILTLRQALRILTKESKFVRGKVFEYIEFLENQNQMLRQALWNRQNSEWLQTRKQGKLARRNETDAIATLILYAKEQGSKNADKMYITYSKLVNNLVGINAGMRDIVSFETLINIGKLEDLFTKLIIDGMENKMYYKEIYKECKRIGNNFMAFLNADIKLLRA